MKDGTEKLEERYACHSNYVSSTFLFLNDSPSLLSLTKKVDNSRSVQDYRVRITLLFLVSLTLASIKVTSSSSPHAPHKDNKSPRFSSSFSITSLKLSPSVFASDNFL